MHYRFIRDSFFGRMVYHLSGKKVFTHKEEAADYVPAEKYLPDYKAPSKELTEDSDVAAGETEAKELDATSAASSETVAKDTNIYVDWDGEDDPENPQNWPFIQKAFFIFEIAFLTTSVYIGSAVYTPGIEEIMEEFQISQTLAALPLSMFVIGYGIGPMVFSPMSENAIFGRTSIYVVTLFIFFILQIPTALAKNIASLSVLRLLGGVFASPALATGGASVVDVLAMPYAPIGIASWAMAAVCGPSLGPLVGSVLTVKGGWRWTFWFMAIISGTSFITLLFFLPESYSKTLLLRKAKRLRAKTGNMNITTEDEVANSKLTVREIAIETLWRPIEISIAEPVVLMINMYIALVYSILYLWFEAYPIAYLGVYGFTLVEMGVSYVSIIVGIGIGCIIYLLWVRKAFTAKLLAGEMVVPEVFIPVAIIGGTLMPIGTFIFGWTVAKDLHWIGSLIGAAIFAAGAFLIFQTLFNYLGMSFYRYLASVFAGNDLFRSVIAGVFPLFGHALFNNLKTDRFAVGWGSSILGFLTLAMLAIPILFYLNGPKLRARSKWAN
ncbi:multidrug resistance protein 7 [Suhomyces tanzawaensis NRRL Y-17324]|uniref:Multidrug resistance protein 7 n=1 Tax=Suhomyces tanzawaensis NRRL Y-17324 TaxID=984487 RepID=A0A1E4SNC5_9ASCO|nr:multidrug resistance protein 7 [Suhomyces tanzawaensis NRRL Y-17324]ODV80927.1 multidrug resistance protein 7 [Suhomyces tanzawaensis NRRL Y-17324]